MSGIKGFLEYTFEYVDWHGDSDALECRVHFIYQRGDPGIMWGDNACPPDPPQIEFDFAEREHWEDGTTRVWNRLASGEWLEEHLAAWMGIQDFDKFKRALPQKGD